jgi:hypothetical protein
VPTTIRILPLFQTRNKAMAWRPLAYIPCEQYYSQEQFNKFDTDTKQFRCFQLYEAGLASYIKAQEPGAMDNVYLQLGDKGKFVNLFVPLAFIIGDNQGGDNICGRAASYGLYARRISRTCDATKAAYDTIAADCCAPLAMERIKALIIAKDWAALHALHQCPSWNPFFNVCYGGSLGGIFTAACPAEALHALENGIIPKSITNVLGGRLKPKATVKLDSACQAWTNLPRQKLMRSSNLPNAPRLLFKDGISTLTNCSAATKVGLLFALVVGSVTRDGKLAFKRLKEDEYLDILYSLEMLLCYWAWLKNDHHWLLDDLDEYEVTKTAIAKMLDTLVTCMPRLKGNGWQIPKMHEQLHVAHNILLFGSHKNIHTGPTEKNHIELSKKTSRRTQLRKSNFDWQVSNRLVDKMIVDLALEHISESPDMVVDVPITGDAAFPYPSSTAFFDLRIRCHPEDASRIEVLLDKPVKQAKYMPPMYVLQHIVQTCFEEVTRASCPDGIVVSCFTELQLSDSLVRSNHGFDDGPWFDYMATQFVNEDGEMYTSPARVELMYFLPSDPDKQFAVVHPAFELKMEHSVLMTWYRMEYNDDVLDISDCPYTVDWALEVFRMDDDSTDPLPVPRLKTVGVHDLCHHQLMVPYHNLSKFMIGVKDQQEWADQFLTSP